VAAAPVTARAQSFNVDCGAEYGEPPASYGGAAAQPGFWNRNPGNSSDPLPIQDLAGGVTAVTLTPGLPVGPASFENPGPSGGDAALLNDYLDLHSSPQFFTFSGLAAGVYTVYTYAWAPDVPTTRTTVVVNDSEPVLVGGDWPGVQQEGVTFARQDVTVGDGEDVVVFMHAPSNGTLNGFQFVYRGAPCYANCDGSTVAPVLNVNDFVCFQSEFAAGDSGANCDGSTTVPVLNVNDFICFQMRFAAGCSAP
jgi:hypothetical protein